VLGQLGFAGRAGLLDGAGMLFVPKLLPPPALGWNGCCVPVLVGVRLLLPGDSGSLNLLAGGELKPGLLDGCMLDMPLFIGMLVEPVYGCMVCMLGEPARL
jgi:hypothetical protein